MSKKSRAAQLIEYGIEHDYTPNRIARLLQKFRLLTPDPHAASLIVPERMLPHPNPPIDVHKPAWEVTEFPDKWVSLLAKKIWITDSHGWGKSITTDQARNLAHALLAAADYQGDNNE